MISFGDAKLEMIWNVIAIAWTFYQYRNSDLGFYVGCY